MDGIFRISSVVGICRNQRIHAQTQRAEFSYVFLPGKCLLTQCWVSADSPCLPAGIEDTHLPNTQYAPWKRSFLMIWYHRQANTHAMHTLKTQFWYAALRICAYLLSLMSAQTAPLGLYASTCMPKWAFSVNSSSEHAQSALEHLVWAG